MQANFSTSQCADARRPSESQTRLSFDAERRERKALVRAVDYTRTGLSEERWASCQEVLTYLIHVGTDRGIFPSVKRIAEACGLGRRTVSRAISDLVKLGVVNQRRRGRQTASYALRLAALAAIDVRLSDPPLDAPFDAPNAPLAAPSVRIGGASAARRVRVDGAANEQHRGINREPTLTPTTTAVAAPSGAPSVEEWSEVVAEVTGCGVNQAAAAVDRARKLGAKPEDVRAIMAEWRSRQDGWQHGEVILYRRIGRFNPQQPPTDGWPALDQAYQARLDLEQRGRDRDAALERQLARRREFIAAREQAERERREQGITLAGLADAIDPALAAGIRRAAGNKERAR